MLAFFVPRRLLGDFLLNPPRTAGIDPPPFGSGKNGAASVGCQALSCAAAHSVNRRGEREQAKVRRRRKANGRQAEPKRIGSKRSQGKRVTT